ARQRVGYELSADDDGHRRVHTHADEQGPKPARQMRDEAPEIGGAAGEVARASLCRLGHSRLVIFERAAIPALLAPTQTAWIDQSALAARTSQARLERRAGCWRRRRQRRRRRWSGRRSARQRYWRLPDEILQGDLLYTKRKPAARAPSLQRVSVKRGC